MRWLLAITLLLISTTPAFAQAAASGTNALIIQFLPPVFLVVILFVVVLIWPNRWVAGGTTLLFSVPTVLLGEALSRWMTPVLAIAVYAFIAFGIVAWRRRGRSASQS